VIHHDTSGVASVLGGEDRVVLSVNLVELGLGEIARRAIIWAARVALCLLDYHTRGSSRPSTKTS